MKLVKAVLDAIADVDKGKEQAFLQDLAPKDAPKNGVPEHTWGGKRWWKEPYPTARGWRIQENVSWLWFGHGFRLLDRNDDQWKSWSTKKDMFQALEDFADRKSIKIPK